MEYIGCSSYIIEMWQYNFKTIEEAAEYYKQIWPCVWIENFKGKIIKKF